MLDDVFDDESEQQQRQYEKHGQAGLKQKRRQI